MSDTSCSSTGVKNIELELGWVRKSVKDAWEWGYFEQDWGLFKKVHHSKKLKEHVDIIIFIERYPLKRCQGCIKLIASKVNCFLNINDLSEVQLCMSSNSWTWECPHTKDGADHVPLIFLRSVIIKAICD